MRRIVDRNADLTLDQPMLSSAVISSTPERSASWILEIANRSLAHQLDRQAQTTWDKASVWSPFQSSADELLAFMAFAVRQGGSHFGAVSYRRGEGGSSQPQAYGSGGGSGNNQGPVVTSKNRSVVEDEILRGRSVLRASDKDGVVTHFKFKDERGAGWFELDGKRLHEGRWNTVRVSDLGKLVYVAADNLTHRNFRADDQVWIKARDDDRSWSLTKRIVIKNVQNANRPIVYVNHQEMADSSFVSVSSLFRVRDEDRNTIKRYRFQDLTSAPSSGHLTYRGKPVEPGKWLQVTADQLHSVLFQASNRRSVDRLRIGAFDGTHWGYRNVRLATSVRPSIETVDGVVFDVLEEKQVSDLISLTQGDQQGIRYQIYDANSNPLSAQLVDGLLPLQSGVVHTLTAAEFARLKIKGGTYEDRRLDDFYLRVDNGQWWSPWAKLTVRTEPHYLEALQGLGWNEFIKPQPGQPLVITFSFLQRTPDYYNGGWENDNFLEMNDEMREGARRALTYWSDVANVKFVEVPEPVGGVIRFGTARGPDRYGSWSYLPADSDPINEGPGGDIWLNNLYWASHSDQREGGHAFRLMNFQIGLALGIHYKEERPSVPMLPPATRNLSFTAVSNIRLAGFGRPSGPMLYDVAVMEAIYGATPDHNSGDDVYRYGIGFQSAFKTIYDAGGIDTIDASQQPSRATIDLAPGGFSRIGSIDVSIAFSTWIENAIGSNGQDEIRGNDIRNVLSGGAGMDVLNGLGDDDLLRGGRGSDVYQIQIGHGNDTIQDRGDGSDLIELRSHLPDKNGLNDLTEDLLFSRDGSDFKIHLALNHGADMEGVITIKGGVGNRIEKLLLVGEDGGAMSPSIDLVSIYQAATSVPTAFRLTSKSSSFGRLAVPV